MPATQERAGARFHALAVTREQYLGLPEDGFKYDMIDGVLYVSPSAKPEHGWRQSRFAQFLANYLDSNPAGRCMIEVDILLPDGGDVLRPDLSFVTNEHLSTLFNQIHGVPDMVCEILSDSTARRDLEEKADRYLHNGVKEYWIVDPRNNTLQLWISRGDQWEKHPEAVLKSTLLPGFEIDSAVFYSR